MWVQIWEMTCPTFPDFPRHHIPSRRGFKISTFQTCHVVLFVLPPRDGGIGSGGGVLKGGGGGGAGQEQGPEEQVQAKDVGGEVGRAGTVHMSWNSQKMCHAIFCFLLSREGLRLSVAAAAAASPPLVPASAPAHAGSDASPPGGARGASRWTSHPSSSCRWVVQRDSKKSIKNYYRTKVSKRAL